MLSVHVTAPFARIATIFTMALALVQVSYGQSGYQVLYNFGGGATDAILPEGELVFDSAGNLYGTTVGGGASGNGTVFELSPNPDGSWKEIVIYSFTGGSDGGSPY